MVSLLCRSLDAAWLLLRHPVLGWKMICSHPRSCSSSVTEGDFNFRGILKWDFEQCKLDGVIWQSNKVDLTTHQTCLAEHWLCFWMSFFFGLASALTAVTRCHGLCFCLLQSYVYSWPPVMHRLISRLAHCVAKAIDVSCDAVSPIIQNM